MGSILEKGEGYRVSIRRKGKEVFKTFKDRETAELYCFYKEKLIDEIDAFSVPESELITLQDAICFKADDHSKNGGDAKSLRDIKNALQLFPEYNELSIQELHYDIILDKMKELLSGKVRRGGAKNDPTTGSLRISSPVTVLKKMVVLAGVFSFLIKEGISIDNPAQKVVTLLRSRISDLSEGKEIS